MKHETWDDIYDSWRFLLQQLGFDTYDLFNFKTIEAYKLTLPLQQYECDWWPKDSIKDRAQSVSKDGQSLYLWETKKGTLHTAEMLLNADGDIKKQTGIWIMASLWDKDNILPNSWRGEICTMMHQKQQIIQSAYPDLHTWHHLSKDALPFSIVSKYREHLFTAKTFEDLLYLTAVETAVIHGNWQMVKYQPIA